jgi:hypothetical protein
MKDPKVENPNAQISRHINIMRTVSPNDFGDDGAPVGEIEIIAIQDTPEIFIKKFLILRDSNKDYFLQMQSTIYTSTHKALDNSVVEEKLRKAGVEL